MPRDWSEVCPYTKQVLSIPADVKKREQINFGGDLSHKNDSPVFSEIRKGLVLNLSFVKGNLWKGIRKK